MTRSPRAALAGALLLAAPAIAGADDAFVEFRVQKSGVALQMAEAAMQSCREAGYHVGVTVVDRFGLTQVSIRDRFAGAHVIETATRKAWTAVSFRTDTLARDAVTWPGTPSAGIRNIGNALPLGCGVPVEAAGSLVAGIGVSGAPGPDITMNAPARASRRLKT